MKIIVTGGAGFIGSAVIRHLIAETDWQVVNLDKLTYAANLDSLDSVAGSNRYAFERADICDAAAVEQIFSRHRPDGIMHLAAESHVDRSIDGPAAFIDTNIVGTYTLLQAALAYWRGLEGEAAARFRFHHVSTDEVFGTLGAEGLFTEETPYKPNSPYSASKAASDHLVRAWGETYALPVVMSNCSNNYGPFHFPEKLIPLVILNAVERKPLPVYGKGENVRDWLFVEDHARALHAVFARGVLGESYNIGGRAERTNLDVVHRICALVDRFLPGRPPAADLITYVTDRPGHDLRYAMDAGKIERDLGWKPLESFDTGLEKTVRWYLDNRPWWEKIRGGVYAGARLGLGKTG